ncbi:MAG: PAC2 family protein [Candidatus Diapherotrites archaeon]
MGTKVRFFKEVKFSHAVLFTGLPGIGLVGKIAVDYLLKQLKAKKVAEIWSDSFPPSVHTQSGLLDLIKDEIYHVHHEGKDFLFLAGPVQPSLDVRMGSMSEHYEFAEAIVNAIAEKGVSEIYTLAGINVGEKRMVLEPKVIVAASSDKNLKEWKALGAVSDKPEGLISGAAGLILGVAKEKGLEGACLMGETNARLIYGDHGAAKKLIELLIQRYGFKVDMSKIKKESQAIEKAFTQLSKQFEEPEPPKPDSTLSYVR